MSAPTEESIAAAIEQQGLTVRELKTSKAEKGLVDKAVEELKNLKKTYKDIIGKDYVSPNAAPPPLIPKKVKQVEEPKGKDTKQAKTEKPAEKGSSAQPAASSSSAAVDIPVGPVFFASTTDADENLKCYLISALCGIPLTVGNTDMSKEVPYLPALVEQKSDQKITIFGANSICRYLARDKEELQWKSEHVNRLLDLEEFDLKPLLSDKKNTATLSAKLETLEASFAENQGQSLIELPLAHFTLYSTLSAALSQVDKESKESKEAQELKFPKVRAVVKKVKDGKLVKTAEQAQAASKNAGGKKEKDKKKAAAAAPWIDTPVVPAVLLSDIDWQSLGLISSLQLIFTAALEAAFAPEKEQLVTPSLLTGIIIRCGNPTFGDFQCNNAMALGKQLKAITGYTGPSMPKDVADRVLRAMPPNTVITSATAAPNGFINIKLSLDTMKTSIYSIVRDGVKAPVAPKLKILVDFSSPNIAKQMHVGHLRSTIIGDCISKVLEFMGFDVMRINHVGDWGTQFGMLIGHLLDTYPNLLSDRPDLDIAGLNELYKASRKRFDEDPIFKERSRENVVKLQAGDAECRAIWDFLCDTSRIEFQKVYDCLKVELKEVGESFYNPLIPSTIVELTSKGLIQISENMKVIKLPHFTYPLILQKSDGGYGYDSTDMAAIRYRSQELSRDWIIYITDAGQSTHFNMCFDAAREAGWLNNESKSVRVDHIGFGVVLDAELGTRLRTRSSDTIGLLGFLVEAQKRMKDSLHARASEGKSNVVGEEQDLAAAKIGCGAVKYFDLKNHPTTDYKFSYDRMLDTKGDTGVYLMYAFARINSILRKGKETKGIDISAVSDVFTNPLTICLEHPSERALAFELLQFGDVISVVVKELLPNRICEYLNSVATKATDFVTQCHVLNAPTEDITKSRLVLCEGVKKVMQKCFDLLGIEPLDRI